jgi:guanine deaminase
MERVCDVACDDPGVDESGWLERAVELARENVAGGGRPFAALVVHNDAIVATGVNTALADVDPTAHAELVAIRAACRALNSLALPGCLLVASGQPCPMCQAAAMIAGLERTIYAANIEITATGGFDSSPVARELARPLTERASSFAHVPVAGAEAPFSEWRERSTLRAP